MTRTRNTIRRGFSLLELMLVLAIIGVLTAVAAYNLIGQSDAARIKASYASMNIIRGALRSYALSNNGAYPSTLDALLAGATPLLSKDHKLADGWGNPFIYATPGSNGQDFDLYSRGKDGLFPSADDLNIWSEQGSTQ